VMRSELLRTTSPGPLVAAGPASDAAQQPLAAPTRADEAGEHEAPGRNFRPLGGHNRLRRWPMRFDQLAPRKG
jgi:hypothetical protein